MSNEDQGVSTVIGNDPSNPHIDASQARMSELRAMRDQIPRFSIPESNKEPKRLNAAASVPADFVEMTSVVLANQKVLVRAEGKSPAEMRDLLRYAEAYGPLADELEAFAQFVRYSVNVARNQAGFEALTIYSTAQRLTKRREYAHLVPYVADMRRLLGRARTGKPETIAKREAAKVAASKPAA